MREPTLGDIVGNIYEKLNGAETVDTEIGDEDNTNVTSAVIDSLTPVVTYKHNPITKQPLAEVVWSWAEPTYLDEDGDPVDPTDPDVIDDIAFDPVVDYMFANANYGDAITKFASSNGSLAVVTEHPIGTDITGAIYAVLKSGITGPITTATAVVSKDTTPPNKPATPVLTSQAGVVTIEWDGLDSSGDPQPEDYAYTEFLAGTSNPPVSVLGRLSGAGQLHIAAEAGTTVYVQAFSYDNSANVSVGSTVTSAVVKSVLDDTGLEAALASKAVIYRQITDPALTGSITEGSWWLQLNSEGVIDKTYSRSGGAWVLDAFNGQNILAAYSVVADNIAANAIVADKILAGAIAAKLLTTGELVADAISSGTLSSIITVSGEIRTASSGKRVVINSDGITLYDTDDSVITFINTNGESYFTGIVSATTLNVIGGMSLLSDENTMVPESVLTLESGIQGPANAPIVTSKWNTLFTLKDSEGADVSPLSAGVFDGKIWAVSTNNGVLRLTWHLMSTGACTDEYVINTSGITDQMYHSAFSIVIDSTSLVAFVGSSSGAKLVLFNLIGSVFTVVSITHVSGAYYMSGSPRLTYNTDSGYLHVTYKSSSSGKEVFRRIDLFDGSLYSTVSNTASNTYADSLTTPKGTYVTTISGVSTYYYGNALSVRATTYSGETDFNNSFPTVDSDTVAIGMLSGTFWSINGMGQYTKHDGGWWTDDASITRDVKASVTYYDSVNGYESKPSPLGSCAHKKGSKLYVSNSWWSPGSPSANVNRLKVYAAVGSAAQKYQGVTAGWSLVLSSVSTIGANAPTATTFPSSTPAKIVNTDGSLEVSGFGTIKASNQPTGKISMATLSNATAAWRQITFNTTEINQGSVVDLANNRLTLYAGMYMVGATLSTASFSTARPTQLAITNTASAPTTGNTVLEDYGPNVAGVHGYAMAAPVVLKATTSLYLWYKTNTASAHNLLNISLWAVKLL